MELLSNNQVWIKIRYLYFSMVFYLLDTWSGCRRIGDTAAVIEGCMF